jgi:hypothetical protein
VPTVLCRRNRWNAITYQPGTSTKWSNIEKTKLVLSFCLAPQCCLTELSPLLSVVMAWLLLFDRYFHSFCTIKLAMRLLRAGLEGMVVGLPREEQGHLPNLEARCSTGFSPTVWL